MLRKVMAATPSADGRVHARTMVAMAGSAKACLGRGIDLVPVVMQGPIETTRDDLLAMAVQAADVEELVWVDGDIEWAPDWIPRLLGHPVDVVGATYRRKDPAGEAYVVGGKLGALKPDARGLMVVRYLGLGLLRMSRKAFTALYKSGQPYRIDGIDGPAGERHQAFHWDISNGARQSEDIVACAKLRALGFPVHLDPVLTCNHVGEAVYAGNFADWLARARAGLKPDKPARRKARR